MSHEPLSRFAGQVPKPRPDHTAIVPNRPTVDRLITALLDSGEIFTVEPSPTQPEVWHFGIFNSAVPLITKIFDIQEVETITCPQCGRTSANPNDVREGYCGHCHDWTTPR